MMVATLAAFVLAPNLAGAAPAAGQLAVPPRVSRVVGGERVSGNAFEAAVAILIDDRLCTGVAVSPRIVVTAAHCIDPPDPSQRITVHWGAQVTDSAGVAARRWGVHPDYCPTCDEDRFDFAFIEVARDLGVRQFAQPLATQGEVDDTLFAGGAVTVVGYGNADTRANAPRGDKRAAEVPIDRFTAGGTEFFAGGQGHDTCAGDSGGPAFVGLADGTLRWAGVTSRGPEPCGNGGYYGVPSVALCWLAEEAGVDLRVNGCDTCDCLVLPHGQDTSGGCRIAGSQRDAPRRDAPAALAVLALLGVWRSGRRRTRCRT